MFEARPIETEADLDWAQAQLDKVIDAPAGSRAARYCEVLATLIEAYESEHYPDPPVDPVDAILFRLEQMGLERKALNPILGPTRVSEILNRRRSLSLDQIQKLHAALGVPLASLVNVPPEAFARARALGLAVSKPARGDHT
jgi:HTH-type transcriptional regulator/antitoxin HigA